MLRNLLGVNRGVSLEYLSPFRASPRISRFLSDSPSAVPHAPRLSALTTPSETNEARKWIEKFQSQSIQRGAVELSFSRSSGPGGQVRREYSLVE